MTAEPQTFPGTAEFTDTWDILIIGAGPAGAVAARQLALAGLDVLLVDRKAFPRRKVCGGCLNERALAGLARAGVLDAVRGLHGVALDVFTLQAGGARVELPSGGGWAVSRAALDLVLGQEAQRAGATVWSETAAIVGSLAGNVRCVELRRGSAVGQDAAAQTVAARVVLVADGLGHPSMNHGPEFTELRRSEKAGTRNSRIGAGCEVAVVPASFRRGTIHMLVGRGGYVGVTQLETGRWNIAAALDPEFVRQRGSLGAAAIALLHEAGSEPIPDLATADWQGTSLLTRSVSRVAAERLFVLGDAAGYVEPFTGEGMACAIESALALSPLAVAACRAWQPDLMSQWQERHRQVMRGRAWLCRGLAAALRRPWLVRTCLVMLRYAPQLAMLIVRRLNTPSGLAETPIDRRSNSEGPRT